MSDMSVTVAGVKMRTPIGVQPTAPLAPWMFNPERYAEWLLKSVEFLKKYMNDQGYDNVEQFRGLALKYIRYPEEIDWKVGKVFVEVDSVRCDGCGLCTQTLCDASYIEGGMAKVRREDCGGCGICLLTCPQGARKVVCEE